MGMWVAMNILAEIRQIAPPKVDPQTMTGALVNYLVTASPNNFQPMNSNFGLLAATSGKRPRNKRERRTKAAENAMVRWQESLVRMNWRNG